MTNNTSPDSFLRGVGYSTHQVSGSCTTLDRESALCAPGATSGELCLKSGFRPRRGAAGACDPHSAGERCLTVSKRCLTWPMPRCRTSALRQRTP
jgi:hypothetical protein